MGSLECRGKMSVKHVSKGEGDIFGSQKMFLELPPNSVAQLERFAIGSCNVYLVE